MKKSLVALATLSAIGSAFADVDVSGGIKMYGVIDESVQSQTLTNPGTQLTTKAVGLYSTSGTSRLGVKGARDLGSDFSAHFQVEIELDPDSSTLLPSAKNRGSFVGLQSVQGGTIRLGTQETTAYEIFAMDVNGRVEYKPQVWRTTASSSTQDRANNSLKYISPEFAGFNVHLMQNFSEANSSTANTNGTTSAFTSYGVKYKSEKLQAAVMQDRLSTTYMGYKFAGLSNAGVATTNLTEYALNYGAASLTTPIIRNIAAVTYDFGVASVNYIYASSYQKGSTPGKLDTNTFGIKVPYDKWVFAYGYGSGSLDSATTTGAVIGTSASTGRAKDGNISDSTLGVTYSFDKSTTAYLYLSKSTSSVGIYDGSNTTMAMGARYNF